MITAAPSGTGARRDIADAEAGPAFLAGRLPDGKGVLDAFAEDDRRCARQTDRRGVGPIFARLVGPFLHLDRRLAAVIADVDLLHGIDVAVGVGGQRHQRAIPAMGVRTIPEGWRQRRGGDAAVAEVELRRRSAGSTDRIHDGGDLAARAGLRHRRRLFLLVGSGCASGRRREWRCRCRARASRWPRRTAAPLARFSSRQISAMASPPTPFSWSNHSPRLSPAISMASAALRAEAQLSARRQRAVRLAQQGARQRPRSAR